MEAALGEIEGGNANLKILASQSDLTAPLAYKINAIVNNYENRIISMNRLDEANKQLMSSLSHDVRTPLTILRGHVTRLNKESMSLEGQNSLSEMNHTITRVGELMDDLLSYTLLTSGKHPFKPTSTDIGRLVRASVAAWYPVFEEKEIQIEVDLPTEETFYWEADPKWMTRVLDNLFQNILRHAADGKYVNIVVDVEKEQIIVADRGPGMNNSSYERGVGIGLSTSNYMLKKMKLKADFISNEDGTRVAIGRT